VLKQRYCSYKHTHLKRTPCREIAKGKTNFNAKLWLRIYYYNATPKTQPAASILKYGRGRGRFPEQNVDILEGVGLRACACACGGAGVVAGGAGVGEEMACVGSAAAEAADKLAL